MSVQFKASASLGYGVNLGVGVGGEGSVMLVNNCEQTPLKLAQIYKAG